MLNIDRSRLYEEQLGRQLATSAGQQEESWQMIEQVAGSQFRASVAGEAVPPSAASTHRGLAFTTLPLQ